MPANEVSLTPFQECDSDELVAMWRCSFEAGVGITDPHSLGEQRNYLLTQLAPNYRIKVARCNDRIVGFVAADDQSIVQLYVATDKFRQGIGTQLLDWAKSQSSGSLWLFTFERNRRAQSFYERNGFTIVARGFEEEQWQLADIKYTWSEAAPSATGC